MDYRELNQRLSEIDDEIRFVNEDKLSDKPLFDYHFVNDYSVDSLKSFIHLVETIGRPHIHQLTDSNVS